MYPESLLQHLWSPWRMTYIQNSHKPEACIFCTLPEMADSPQNLIVYRGQHVYAVLNRYPYTSGHLMIVPYSHQPSLDGLDAATRAEIMEVTTQAVDALRSEYRPQGFNLGINLGEVSGAGVADHVHLHIVPRWSGDTNFMSTVGSTRVLPEALEVTYWRIFKAWKR
jgi:ATP adenylyltransferase